MRKAVKKSTGFPVGRPRMGEVRPETPAMLYARKYREANREKLRELARIYAAKLRAERPEHVKKLAHGTRTRRKAYMNWAAQHGDKVAVEVKFEVVRVQLSLF